MAKGMLKILQHLLNDFHRLFDHFVGTRHSEQTGDTNTSRKRDWNCLELKDSIKKLLFSLMTLTTPIFRTWHIFLFGVSWSYTKRLIRWLSLQIRTESWIFIAWFINVIRFVLWEWQTKMCCGFTFATTKSRSIQYDFKIKSGEIKEVFLIPLLRHYLNFSKAIVKCFYCKNMWL